MVVQESNGNGNLVNDGGQSHGLLQVQLQNNEQPATCDAGGCTYDDYLKILEQGVNGHSGNGALSPPGVAYWVGQNSPGPALRSYNTGSFPDKFDYSKASPKSAESYTSDIGNRLAGVSAGQFPTKHWLQQMCGFQPSNTY